MLATHRDSRCIQNGDHFIAVADRQDLRRQHMADARERGAQLIIAEDKTADVHCGHARYAFARLHAAASGVDRLQTPLIGVTGTDGKTTCASFIQALLGTGAARVGTLGFHDGKTETPSPLTTPSAEALHDFLCELDADCPGVAVEISSHGAGQERLAGLSLQALIVTGLGHDHLDYHKTRERYLHAKLKAVRLLPAGALCVINADDELAHIVKHAVSSVGGRCVSIGCTRGDIRLFQEGAQNGVQQWRLRSQYADYPLQIPMIGYHNAWNAAAAAVALGALALPLSPLLAACRELPQVPGRLELCQDQPATYVDYAHTPQALATAIQALRQSHPGKKIINVFGCGGDRDHDKRAAMGTVAATADFSIICNDNPRSENPADIAHAICGSHAVADSIDQLHDDVKFHVQLDRGLAIKAAMELADADSVILVAGKGHEQYQIIGDQRLPWNDCEFIRGLAAQGDATQ